MAMLKKFDTINCLVKCQIDNPSSGAVTGGGGESVPGSPKKGEEIRFREVIPVPVSLWEEA